MFTELAEILQANLDTNIIKTWIGHIEELEVIWETKIQEMSQKRKHNSNDDQDQSSSGKVTAKKRKDLGSVRT